MDIVPKHTEEIFVGMCRRVGVDAKTFDFSKKNWFQEYEWTFKEEDDFRTG